MFFLISFPTVFPHDPLYSQKLPLPPSEASPQLERCFLVGEFWRPGGKERGPGARTWFSLPGPCRARQKPHHSLPATLQTAWSGVGRGCQGQTRGRLNSPDHFYVGFLLPGAELEHKKGPAHCKARELQDTVSLPGWLSRAREGEPYPLLCPQASKVFLPGKVFPAEEMLHFREEIFFGG